MKRLNTVWKYFKRLMPRKRIYIEGHVSEELQEQALPDLDLANEAEIPGETAPQEPEASDEALPDNLESAEQYLLPVNLTLFHLRPQILVDLTVPGNDFGCRRYTGL